MDRKIIPLCLTQLATAVMAGPRTSPETFLSEHIDTTIPALSVIPALLEAGDLAGAEKVFADHVRASLKSGKVNKEWIDKEYSPADMAKLAARAGKVMDYELSSVGIPYRFPNRKIDWEFNPTPNQYCEWTYQLSRHWDWSILAEYYVKTGDERAVTVWMEMADSWLNQELVPENGGAYTTKCWRTLEAGIRMRTWPHHIAAFIGSPQVTDEFIARYFASVWEHGWRVRKNTTAGNWLLTELQGLLRTAIFYPFLKDAAAWRKYALARLKAEFSLQVYPDGFQCELTTAYHGVSINEYRGIYDLYLRLGEEPPAFLKEGLERMYEVYMHLCTPLMRTPDINDGGQVNVSRSCASALELYPDRDDLRWFATLGKEGAPPEFTSSLLPYSGAVTFRSSWRPDAVWGYLDASPFGRGHQHEDKLNFLLQAYGRIMLTEAGNHYYDTSDTREYAKSTRAHNTVRIDGLDQNTRRTYAWHPADIGKFADVAFTNAPGRDAARASFTSGYAPKLLKVVHDRNVLFVKDAEGLAPFFVIIDRLTAPDDANHSYEILWHLENCALSIDGRTFTGDFGKGIGLFAAASDPDAVVTDRKGQTSPELQGWASVWTPGNSRRPIPTPVVSGSFKGSRRIVTVLYPYRDGICATRGVRASSDPSEKGLSLLFADGSELTLDEQL